MKTTTLIRFLAAAGSSSLLAGSAFDIIIIPPPDSPCSEVAVYTNHGDYVSCVAHHPELWGATGNSDAGRSSIGK